MFQPGPECVCSEARSHPLRVYVHAGGAIQQLVHGGEVPAAGGLDQPVRLRHRVRALSWGRVICKRRGLVTKPCRPSRGEGKS
jgi:hypothetical protein